MSDVLMGILGAVTTLVILSWVSILPTIGLLWLFGWLP